MAVYEAHTWETGETIDADMLNRMEDGIAKNDSEINDMYIQNGETITLKNGFYNGDLTDTKKLITIAIPLAKSLKYVTNVVCATFKANISNAGGYCLTTSYVSGGSQYANLISSITIEKNTNTLFIAFTRSTGFEHANNNDGVQSRTSEVVLTFTTK